jgi:hypothetical protein
MSDPANDLLAEFLAHPEVVALDKASSGLQKTWTESADLAGVDPLTVLDAATKMVAALLVQLSPKSASSRREMANQHKQLALALANDALKTPLPPVKITQKPWLN